MRDYHVGIEEVDMANEDPDKVVQSMRVDAKSDNQMLSDANSQGVYSSEMSAIVPIDMPISLSEASQAAALQQFK